MCLFIPIFLRKKLSVLFEGLNGVNRLATKDEKCY